MIPLIDKPVIIDYYFIQVALKFISKIPGFLGFNRSDLMDTGNDPIF